MRNFSALTKVGEPPPPRPHIHPMTAPHIPPPGVTPIRFVPVPSRTNRHDGWTPDRQRAFIDALALIGIVAAAAAEVGKSPKSAYALRARAGAESFAAAWDEALADGRLNATFLAVHRAVHGVMVPVFYKGRQVGERRVYNDRLMIAALRRAKPEIYGGDSW